MSILVKRLILLDDFQTNTYLAWSKENKDAVVIDPAAKPAEILAEIERLELNVRYIINTHGHSDHIGANEKLKELTDAKLCIHELDEDLLFDTNKNLSSFLAKNITSPAPDLLLKDGDKIKLGQDVFKVIHTPGHSRGSICLFDTKDAILFSGDTIFFEGLGRTDLPGSNQADLIHSINDILFKLPEQTKVYPGHGGVTTIKHEKQYNPVTLF